MSAGSELLLLKARHPDFNDLSTRVISDVKKTTHDCFKTKETYFREDVQLTSNLTSFGTTHQFDINRSDGFVGQFMLEVLFADTNAVTGDLPLWTLINYIEIRVSGQPVYRYSGESLALLLCIINSKKDIKDYLGALVGGDGGAGGAELNGTRYITPIIAPGSNGILAAHADMAQNPAFPIGKCSTDMNILINLRASADWASAGTITITSVRLLYKRYRVQNDIGVPTTKAGKQIVYSYNTIYILDQDITSAQTSGTTYQYDMSNVITDGDLQFLAWYNTVDGSYSTLKDYFASQTVQEWYLKFRGTTNLFECLSDNEHTIKYMLDFKDKSIFPQSSGKYYVAPISANYAWQINNLGAAGANFHLEQVTLYQKAVATDTVKIHVMAVYKAVINLYSSRVVEDVTVHPNQGVPQ